MTTSPDTLVWMSRAADLGNRLKFHPVVDRAVGVDGAIRIAGSRTDLPHGRIVDLPPVVGMQAMVLAYGKDDGFGLPEPGEDGMRKLTIPDVARVTS